MWTCNQGLKVKSLQPTSEKNNLTQQASDCILYQSACNSGCIYYSQCNQCINVKFTTSQIKRH